MSTQLKNIRYHVERNYLGTNIKYTYGFDGWPRSGFNRQTTEISLRRVKTCDASDDELQIEVTIREMKGDKNRVFTTVGSMNIPAKDIPELIQRIQTDFRDILDKRVS